MKLVSVVIPTYQHADAIVDCIDSVIAQTYQNIEIIVVDDGSTDDTKSILEPYGTTITYLYQDNSGSNPARNRGFRAAKGEYVIFCDADVIMEEDMIAEMVNALEKHPDCDFVYSDFIFGWKFFKGQPFNVQELRKVNYIHTSSLVRRKAFPGFDEEIQRFQDWDVWLTMAEQGKQGIYLPETLMHVRVEGQSRIGSKWLPKFVYKLPWRLFPFKLKRVEKYKAAREIIAAKHNL